MTIKVRKDNPVAKAMQNKRFHEKVRDDRKVNYNRTNNKDAIRRSLEAEHAEEDSDELSSVL